MASGTGRRQRNRVERRRRLEDVALELFEEHGFDETTIDQITAAADLAPRTFFSYFASKDDLVLADYAERLDRILGELAQRAPTEPAWDALRGAFAAVAVDYEAEADRIRRRFTIMATNPSVLARSLQLQAGWEASLTEALRGRIDAAVDDPIPALLAAIALTITRSSIRHWLTAQDTPPLPDLVQDAFDLLAHGVARP